MNPFLSLHSPMKESGPSLNLYITQHIGEPGWGPSRLRPEAWPLTSEPYGSKRTSFNIILALGHHHLMIMIMTAMMIGWQCFLNQMLVFKVYWSISKTICSFISKSPFILRYVLTLWKFYFQKTKHILFIEKPVMKLHFYSRKPYYFEACKVLPSASFS